MKTPWFWNNLSIGWNLIFIFYELFWTWYNYTNGNDGRAMFHAVAFCFFGFMLTNAIVWRIEHPKPKEI